MRTIDLASWPRRELYEKFFNISCPFFSVTFPVDVTAVHAWAKQNRVSFYHLLTWLSTGAMNAVPEFRLRVIDGQLVEIDRGDPSFTSLRKGERQFRIITVPFEDDPLTFCRHAKEADDAQTAFIRMEKESASLIFVSCLPWFDVTGLREEHRGDPDDLIPHLTWGKFYPLQNGRLELHMTVTANHRVADGFHVGEFKAELDRRIAALCCAKEG
ncbi:MAG: chloramphenicol acetyltransferase [Oscillospiraceae bacterium]|nr:chloramphenicol acetyltransferase [Oscillospiraceae bacterium]